jgi:hypothetical protein
MFSSVSFCFLFFFSTVLASRSYVEGWGVGGGFSHTVGEEEDRASFFFFLELCCFLRCYRRGETAVLSSLPFHPPPPNKGCLLWVYSISSLFFFEFVLLVLLIHVCIDALFFSVLLFFSVSLSLPSPFLTEGYFAAFPRPFQDVYTLSRVTE